MEISESVAKEECTLCGGALDVVTINHRNIILRCRECRMTVSKNKNEFLDYTEPALA